MIGLPRQLGVLRTAVQTFFTAIHDLFDDGDIDPPFDPQQPNASTVETEKAGFLKELFKKRYGISYEVFDFLTDRASKMDLKTVTLPGFGEVPVFEPGDHEKLDAYMGITDPDHHISPPAGYNDSSGFEFYPDASGPLKPTAEFSKTAFAAYADSVVLSKMILLMESPATDLVAGAGAAAGQLSNC